MDQLFAAHGSKKLHHANLIYGGAGEDHAIEEFIPDIVQMTVELFHVARRYVSGFVARRGQQRELDLQRGIAEQPGILDFRFMLLGHEVEQDDLERADVLAQGTLLPDELDALFLEFFAGGECAGNFDRHGAR